MTLEGEVVSTGALKQELGKAVKRYWIKGRRKYAGFSDKSYYVPTRDELEAFVKEHRIKPAHFYGELFDCDDFAFIFKGSVCSYARDHPDIAPQAPLAVGIVWAKFSWPETKGLHAANVAVVMERNDRKVVWLEPQDGEQHKLKECKGGLELLLF